MPTSGWQTAVPGQTRGNLRESTTSAHVMDCAGDLLPQQRRLLVAVAQKQHLEPNTLAVRLTERARPVMNGPSKDPNQGVLILGMRGQGQASTGSGQAGLDVPRRHRVSGRG